MQHARSRVRGVRTAALAAALSAAAASLAACGSPDAETVGRANWRGCQVEVQTRPFPPTLGSNEVVVILTEAHRRPVYDAIVSVRGRSSAPWVQAIEDGHVGVYRRAVMFTPEPGAALEVQVQRGNDEAIFSFAVHLSATP